MYVRAFSYLFFEPYVKRHFSIQGEGFRTLSISLEITCSLLFLFLPILSFFPQGETLFLPLEGFPGVLVPLSSVILNHRLVALTFKIYFAPSDQHFHTWAEV